MTRARLPSRPATGSVTAAILAIGFFGVPGAPGRAQTKEAGGPGRAAEPRVPEKAGKVLRALRLQSESPRIDGRLDEAVWARADSIDDFVQWEPENMAPLSERTVIRVLYDDRYLYVGICAHDSEPSRIVSGLGRRDNVPPSDQLFIGFDPRHDHLTGYGFGTNPSGVQADFAFFDDADFDGDYDAVWEVGTQTTQEGWTAEFQIPFSQMRFDVPEEGEVVWGFDSRREILRKAEEGQWVGRPRGLRGQVSRFGHLVFPEGLSPPQRIEVLPFTVARRDDLATAARAHYSADAGIDLRLGLGTAATLAATINPDFGQVELDPAVLNLTVFETLFPEKRSFFLEDSRTFVPPYFLFQLFHSRRIGRQPGRFPLPATDRLIEPLTSYGAARIQRDILGGSGNVGALVTAVVRERDAEAFTGGIDYKIRWDLNRFEWNGHWAVTRAPGADGLRTGFGGVSNLFFSGKHFGFFGHFDHMGRTFRVNDVGFQRNRNDRTSFNLGFNAGQPDPWGGFRSLRPDATRVFASVQSDRRKTRRLSLDLSRGGDEAGGWSASLRPRLELQPSPRWQASITAGYSFGRDAAQWIANGDFDEDGATDHVYGRLRRDVIDVTVRSTFAVHRDLTLQLFLQPFVAVGDYSATRKLARPRSFEFEPVDLPFNPDFNSRSLRGNLVLRWEYVRGSTLFVAWNLSTLDDSRPGVFRPLSDLGDALGADGTHVLLVKANYWWSL